MDRVLEPMGSMVLASAGVGDGGIADAAGDAAGDLAASIGELVEQVPWSTQGVMIGLFAGGLILALFGRRWMRLGFAMLGLLVGAQAGLFIPAAFGFAPAAWIGASIGGVLGLIAGLVAYKATLIGVMGLTGALAGPAVAMIVLLAGPGVGPPPETAGEPGGRAAETGEPAPRLASDPLHLGLLPKSTVKDAAVDEAERRGVANASDIADSIEESAADVGRALGELAENIEPYWTALNTRERLIVVFAGFVGTLVGVAVGFLMPTFAGMLVTSYGGAGVSLWSGAWLATALEPGLSAKLPDSAWTWLGIWLVLGSLCLALRRGKKKPAASSDDDED